MTANLFLVLTTFQNSCNDSFCIHSNFGWLNVQELETMTTLSNWILRAQFGLSSCYDAWIRLHGRVKINHFWKEKLDASNIPGFIWDSCGCLPDFSRVAVFEEVREGNSYISLVKLATKWWSGKILGDLEKTFLVCACACPGHFGISDHFVWLCPHSRVGMGCW